MIVSVCKCIMYHFHLKVYKHIHKTLIYRSTICKMTGPVILFPKRSQFSQISHYLYLTHMKSYINVFKAHATSTQILSLWETLTLMPVLTAYSFSFWSGSPLDKYTGDFEPSVLFKGVLVALYFRHLEQSAVWIIMMYFEMNNHLDFCITFWAYKESSWAVTSHQGFRKN